MSGAHPAIHALREYGSAIRGDWGSIDGRSVRGDLDRLADALEGRGAAAEYDLTYWREDLGICPQGGGHWVDHCGDECVRTTPAPGGDDR